MNPRRLLLPGPLLVRLAIWLCICLVFPLSVTTLQLSFQLEVLGSITSRPDRVLAWGQERCCVELTERVLAYLEKAERKETDPHAATDYRIAWITTKWARHGVPDWAWLKDSPAHTAAVFQTLHCLPCEVWPRMEAQRKQALGAHYEEFWGGASSPRKPVQSVKLSDASGKGRAA